MSVPTSRPPKPPAEKRSPPVLDPKAAPPSVETASSSNNEAAESTSGIATLVFERTFWIRFWEQLNGEAGAGYLLSFVFHLVLLSLLAIPVIHELQKEEPITTVIVGGDFSDDQGIIGDPLNTGLDLALPEPTPGTDLNAPQLTDLGASALAAMDVDPNQIQGLNNLGGGAGSAPGAGGGKKGTGGSGDSLRIPDPPNAIRAGNFSVWPWPVINDRLVNGRPQHGEPGDYPKVFQSYDIVIRVRVPGSEKRIPVSHFTGQVVGTDKYFQKIPQNASYFDGNGKLVPARVGQSIPVVNGIAELLIRVPPASKSEVRDTITIKCKTIDEEQTIELVFRALNSSPEESSENL